MTTDCYACSMNERVGALPVHEEIVVEGSWRVAHAFNSALPGWLVLVARRHVGALEDMTAQDAQLLGLLLHRCSQALRAVTGCHKCYFMFFAEAEGFSHLHVHVVPRMPSFTSDQLGPRVFGFLARPEADWLPPDEQTALAIRLRDALADQPQPRP